MDTTTRKIIVIAFLVCGTIIHASNSVSLFTQGNNAYQAGQLERALDCYRSIKNKGSAVWYNMGNCYYHQQNMANALICWQRAIPGCGYRDYYDIEAHTILAQQALGLDTVAAPVFIFLNAVAIAFSVWVIQWIFLLLWLIFWLAIVYRSRILFFNLWIFGILLGIIFWGLVVYMQWSNERYQRAIIMSKNMTLQAGPHHDYHNLGSISYGSLVDLVEERDGWYKIAKDDKYGWVAAASIELVKNS